jgi:hypothetical protein
MRIHVYFFLLEKCNHFLSSSISILPAHWTGTESTTGEDESGDTRDEGDEGDEKSGMTKAKLGKRMLGMKKGR